MAHSQRETLILSRDDQRRAASRLRRDGIFVLPGLLEAARVAELRREVDTMLTSPGAGMGFEGNPGGPSVRLLMDRVEPAAIPATVALFRSVALEEIAREYLSDCAFCADAVITHHVRVGTHTDVHFDTRRSLTCMIYLNDVDRGNAAFRYAAGTHRANHAFRIAYMRAAGAPESLPNIPAPEERMELADIEGPAGTLILFDSDGFHSAGTLSAGRERMAIRSRSLARHWLEGRLLKRFIRSVFNPFRLKPPLVPAGRRTTSGQARAQG
jgi:hypothetical protein